MEFLCLYLFLSIEEIFWKFFSSVFNNYFLRDFFFINFKKNFNVKLGEWEKIYGYFIFNKMYFW